MKTTIFYGLQRKTIKEMTARFGGLAQEIKATQKAVKAMAAEAADGRAEMSTILETVKGVAITIRVKIEGRT